MNSKKEEITELRVSFSGPDPVGSKARFMQLIGELPMLASSLGVVEGIREGQYLDEMDPSEAFSESEDSSIVSIFFPGAEQAARLMNEVQGNRGDDASWTFEVRTLRKETWRNAWDAEFKPFKTGLFDVVPFSNVGEYFSEKSRHLLAIDAGGAFGTGQHATTLACLLALEKIWETAPENSLWPWPSFLDVGTGTGILGIAAAKMGATRIDATDLDPAAVEAARRNAKINNIQMTTIETAAVPTETCYDIVVSNVLTEALVPLIPDLVAATAKDGRLLLAGYTENDVPRFVELVETSGGILCFEVKVRGWVCQVFKKSP